MTIELRLSDVDPPAPDPPRTIYRDVLSLPDPVKLGMTVRYFNHDEVTLYFKITGSGTGYTFGTVELGALASGANAYINLDQFASRAKPASGEFTAGEFEEVVTLTLKAYTDAGYTEPPKWTFQRNVTVHWIKSDDPSWTQDVLNNFDDGTVQGWAVADEAGNDGGYPTIGVATDYVLSAPYSCLMTGRRSSPPGEGEVRSRLYKSFSTPDRPVIFAVFDVKMQCIRGTDPNYNKYLRLQRNTTLLVFLGKPYDTAFSDYIPRQKWMRVVVPLPRNVSVELRVVHDHYVRWTTGYGYLWMDDFKIISK